MAKLKGSPKTGGRQKGSKNFKPQMKPLRIQLADLGWNTAEKLVELYNTIEEPKMKLQILDLIVKYTNVVPLVETYVPDNQDEDETEDANATASIVNFCRE